MQNGGWVFILREGGVLNHRQGDTSALESDPLECETCGPHTPRKSAAADLRGPSAVFLRERRRNCDRHIHEPDAAVAAPR